MTAAELLPASTQVMADRVRHGHDADAELTASLA
jgi:hypothetical protein